MPSQRKQTEILSWHLDWPSWNAGPFGNYLRQWRRGSRWASWLRCSHLSCQGNFIPLTTGLDSTDAFRYCCQCTSQIIFDLISVHVRSFNRASTWLICPWPDGSLGSFNPERVRVPSANFEDSYVLHHNEIAKRTSTYLYAPQVCQTRIRNPWNMNLQSSKAMTLAPPDNWLMEKEWVGTWEGWEPQYERSEFYGRKCPERHRR